MMALTTRSSARVFQYMPFFAGSSERSADPVDEHDISSFGHFASTDQVVNDPRDATCEARIV